MEWLRHVLEQAEPFDGASITAFNLEPVGDERGFTGVVTRVHLVHDHGTAPTSVIAKFPLAERAVGSSYRPKGTAVPPRLVARAAREGDFYRLAGQGSAQIPACYFSHTGTDSGEVVLLLEDVPGEPGDALTGCSIDQARAVLMAISKIHARWWRSRGLESLAWLDQWQPGNEGRASAYKDRVPAIIDHYHRQLPPGAIQLLRDLAPALDAILGRLASAPPTLIHCDLHLDNVIFNHALPGMPATILDWQSPSLGPAMLDTGGFIAEALSIEDRRASETSLLREYHELLEASGVVDYRFDALYGDYLLTLCVRLAGQVGWLYRVIPHKLSGREAALVAALFDPGRVLTALLDHQHELPIAKVR